MANQIKYILQKIGLAIIVHAMKDFQKGCDEAREFLFDDKSELRYWCKKAEVSVETVRKTALKSIKLRNLPDYKGASHEARSISRSRQPYRNISKIKV